MQEAGNWDIRAASPRGMKFRGNQYTGRMRVE
jgi:hypothetical protein